MLAEKLVHHLRDVLTDDLLLQRALAAAYVLASRRMRRQSHALDKLYLTFHRSERRDWRSSVAISQLPRPRLPIHPPLSPMRVRTHRAVQLRILSHKFSRQRMRARRRHLRSLKSHHDQRRLPKGSEMGRRNRDRDQTSQQRAWRYGRTGTYVRSSASL